MSNSSNDQIHEGDVRLINGVPSLVLKTWFMDDDSGEVFSWLVCPVKPVTGDDDIEPTGSVCYVQAGHAGSPEETLHAILDPDPDDPTEGGGYALAGMACSMTPKFIGKLLYKVLPEQWLNAARCWYSQIDEPKGPYQWDFQNHNSKEDWDLVHTMCRPEDVEEMLEDEAEAARKEREAEDHHRTFNSNDKFGSMCGGCPYEDCLTEPCASCKGP